MILKPFYGLDSPARIKAVKERYQAFLKTWPETRQRIPYALMQEMRIPPELANYNEIVHRSSCS